MNKIKILAIYFLTSFHIYNYSNIITFFVNEYGYRLEPEHKLFHGLTKKIIKEHTKKLKLPIFQQIMHFMKMSFPREWKSQLFSGGILIFCSI